MNEVVSKRSFAGFYLSLFVLSLFCGLMLLAVLGIFFHAYHTPEFQKRYYGLVIMSAFVFAGWCYAVYRYCRCSPSVRVDKDFLTLNNRKTISWDEVENIELTGKQPFMFLEDWEGMRIKFRDGKQRVMLDSSYTNLNEVKLFIKCVIIEKRAALPAGITDVSEDEIGLQNFVFYKGNQFTNVNGILMWVIFFGLALLAGKYHHSIIVAVFWLATAAANFFGFSSFFNYFGLSGDLLLVRNHNFWWRNKAYRLADIEEVAFDQPNKRPYRAIIITKDYKIHYYYCATLWRKQRLDLKQALTDKGIKVRDNAFGDNKDDFIR